MLLGPPASSATAKTLCSPLLLRAGKGRSIRGKKEKTPVIFEGLVENSDQFGQIFKKTSI
jgi:hypothetical protein